MNILKKAIFSLNPIRLFVIIKNAIAGLIKYFFQIFLFTLLLTLYLSLRSIEKILKFIPIPSSIKKSFLYIISSIFNRIIQILDRGRRETISRTELIELSLRNMRAKKTRTLVTIGGMSIGISAIVFLVSIGYGIQQLVINRVARLDEMKQTDVSPQPGGKIKITDETLSQFTSITNVENALPLITVVGKVNYQNSVSDMAVYGVTSQYLVQSAIKPIRGQIFENDELSTVQPSVTSDAKTTNPKITNLDEYGATIDSGTVSIPSDQWIRVRSSPSLTSEVLGYTKRTENAFSADLIWGSSYSDSPAGKSGSTQSGEVLGRWVKAKVPLWTKESCDKSKDDDCENGGYKVKRDQLLAQVQSEGYFAEINATFNGTGKVLATTTEENLDEAVDWVEIPSESGSAKHLDTKIVKLSTDQRREAVVNLATLKVLGLTEDEAVGKKFSVTFSVIGDLLNNIDEKLESEPTEYTIIGVTPEDKTPIFYVPFIDLRSLGITNYSQVKVISKEKNQLSMIRKQIESLGYSTRSVVDSVDQINTLFTSVRLILLLVGMAALLVAALGMFNTLTVSLLERTREVGFLKAIGMKSSEVQELFLTESLLMGFFGGIVGIAIGLGLGKLLGMVLSIFTIYKGIGTIDISYAPPTFILTVAILSLIVGMITGIYPARRTKKISALNALRYE